jgi:hypothetical protein
VVIGGPNPHDEIIRRLHAGDITLAEADALAEFVETLKVLTARVILAEQERPCSQL